MITFFVQGSGKRLRVPGKGSRKRLNPQASVDSIEQWKTFNMSPSDLQVRHPHRQVMSFSLLYLSSE